MPARRINGENHLIRKFDVVGVDAEAFPEFTRHVALVGEERPSHTATDPLNLVHMGPPLQRGEFPGAVHSHGSAGLSVDETLQISVFVDEAESEYEAAKVRDNGMFQYVVVPHVRPVPALDGTTKFRQFSCAGFVIEAYREAAIDLVLTEAAGLPPVDLGTLLRQYPDQVLPRHVISALINSADRVVSRPLAGDSVRNFHAGVIRGLQNVGIRKRIGLEGEGPWSVVLAGYVINSLSRSDAEIRSQPYTPQAGDEFFPSHQNQNSPL